MLLSTGLAATALLLSGVQAGVPNLLPRFANRDVDANENTTPEPTTTTTRFPLPFESATTTRATTTTANSDPASGIVIVPMMYTFEINSGQLQKCAAAGPSVGCAFESCFVPRLTDQNGNVIAGAATKEDKDWVCAAFLGRPGHAIYGLKYTEVSCKRPFPIGGGVNFCTDGDGGMTAHFPSFILDGKPGWCVLQGGTEGYSSCTLSF
ncbi:hypothetical protein BKA56DRAFT_668845 [Ilyonectria sp. MPI-CAGE-AT-0026]|nr:hypothetical protein BKA56DRAFT_668845 [Ilyonectria sp. MPI-CAGE-AT-0026]